MQSEDKGEHININLDSKCDEKDDVISDECCWQKKKSHYRNSQIYFMTLNVNRINVGSESKYRKGHNNSPNHMIRKRYH